MASYPCRNIEELKEVIARLDEINPLISKMVEFEARTGLRYSDTSKVKFKDVMINGVIRDSFEVIQSKTYNARTKRKKNPMSHSEAAQKSKIIIHINDQLRELIRSLFVSNGHQELMFGSSHHFSKGRAISLQYINRAFKKVAIEMQLPYQLSSHSMRKSFALTLIDGGAPIHVVMEALGHSSLSATQHYVKTFFDQKTEYVKAINF